MNQNASGRALSAGLAFVLMAMLAACAVDGSSPPSQAAPVDSADVIDVPAPDNNDPIEPVNRGIFRFNEVLDGLVLKPVAHIYRGVLPDFMQTGVRNVLTNLTGPVVFLNSALQGDGTNAERTAGRFLVNSTIGIAGIFDVASEMGIPKQHNKDFGQTMGVHGVGAGPYLMLPLFGPSQARDTVGTVVDMFADPFTYILNRPQNIGVGTTRFIVKRGDLIPFSDRLYRDSLDPYASLRSIYQQNRQSVIDNYLNSDAAGIDKK